MRSFLSGKEPDWTGQSYFNKKRRSELCVRLFCCIFEAYMGSAREKESPVRPEGKRTRKPESIEIYKRNKYEIRIQFIHVENTDIFRGFRRHETALHDPRRIARRGRHYGRMVSYIRSLCDESSGSKDQPRLSGCRFLLYSVRFCHWLCLRRPLENDDREGFHQTQGHTPSPDGRHGGCDWGGHVLFRDVRCGTLRR